MLHPDGRERYAQSALTSGGRSPGERRASVERGRSVTSVEPHAEVEVQYNEFHATARRGGCARSLAKARKKQYTLTIGEKPNCQRST